MNLPDLESLRCFDAAARLLSFSAASREVALSAPAFTTRIHHLEELLGAKLFVRDNRRVELTHAGRRLLPQARRALEETQRCVEMFCNFGRDENELTIGCFLEVGLYWLVPLLSELQRNHPERMLHLRFGDSLDLLRGVREGSIDAAITSFRVSDAIYQHTPLREVCFAFVASPELLRRQPFDSAADAAGHVLLDMRSDLSLFRYFADARPAGEIWGFRRVEQLGIVPAIRMRLVEGVGVAVLPVAFILADLERGRLVRLFPSTQVRSDQYSLVWGRGHAREESLRLLAQELSEGVARIAERNARRAALLSARSPKSPREPDIAYHDTGIAPAPGCSRNDPPAGPP